MKFEMKTFKIIFFLIILTNFNLFGQIKGLSQLENKDLMNQDLESLAGSQQMLTGELSPAANAFDPDKYYPGAGDVLSLMIDPMIPLEKTVLVSPGNIILIPRIGEIKIEDMSLTQLRENLDSLVKKRNPDSKASLVLRKPRLVIITISGNVNFPGNYTLPASYKVSTAVKIAQNRKASSVLSQTEAQMYSEYEQKREQINKYFEESGIASESKFWKRNITVLHNDGTSTTADIEKALANSDSEYDPYILEGDEIYVPYEPEDYPVISVSGAVQRPALVNYKQGDRVSDLLSMSYGFKENADLDNIRLVRANGDELQIKTDEDMNIRGDDFLLEPGSMIVVKEKNIIEKQKQGIVSVRGNVHNPGIYNITKDETKLKEIIEKAGGFTDEAYLPLATIIRRDKEHLSLSSLQREQMQYFQYSDLKLEDTLRYKLDITLRKPVVACNFMELFEKGNETHNVILQDGDVIEVPSNPRKVYVLGQVNNPGYVDHEPGKGIEWYIQKAGGYGPRAEEDRVRIIRGATNVWVEDDVVYAGDFIYVPRPPDIPLAYELQSYSLIASFVSTGIALVSLLFYIFRQ